MQVYWPSLKLDRRQRNLRKAAMGLATFWLVIFWLVPVLFVSSLTTLSALSEKAPWLSPVVNASPVITVCCIPPDHEVPRYRRLAW